MRWMVTLGNLKRLAVVYSSAKSSSQTSNHVGNTKVNICLLLINLTEFTGEYMNDYPSMTRSTTLFMKTVQSPVINVMEIKSSDSVSIRSLIDIIIVNIEALRVLKIDVNVFVNSIIM